MTSTQDFVDFFTDSRGELLYFIITFVIYQAALLMAIGQSTRSKHETAAIRYSVGLAGVEASWLVLMFGALYSLIAGTEGSLLPLLERAMNALILVWLGYAFISAETTKDIYFVRGGALAISVVVLLGLGYSLSAWDSTQPFASQNIALGWTTLPALLAIMGMVIMFTTFNDIADIPLKFLFGMLMVVGHGYSLANDNGVGAIRWAFFIGSILVVVVVYRMVLDRMRMVIEEVATYAEAISKPVPTITTANLNTGTATNTSSGSSTPAPVLPPAVKNNEVVNLSGSVKAVTAGTSSLGGRNEAIEILKALGVMLDNPEMDQLPTQIVMAVAQAFKSDVIALMSNTEKTWADIMAARDQINQRIITGMLMNMDEQPSLLKALKENRQMYLTIEGHEDELRDLYTRLDVIPIGPVYFQPLTRNGVVVGMLIIGFPYTHRELSVSDLRLLESIGPIAARLLVMTRNAAQKRQEAEKRAIQSIIDSSIDSITEDNRNERETLHNNLEQAHVQIRELNTFLHQLESDLEKERKRVQELLMDGEDAMSISQRITTLSVEREQLRDEREKLSNALVEAKVSLISAVSEADDTAVYESMLEELRREYEQMQAQKANLEAQLRHIREATDINAAPGHLREVLDTLTTERAQILADRDILAGQLDQTRHQLEGLGIEGGIVGVVRQFAQLTEERIYYKTLAEKAAQDREALLNERRNLEAALNEEARRDSRIQAMEEEVARLTQDREALLKSRDSLKLEREALMAEREMRQTERARMLAHNDSLKMELDETLDLLHQANEERQELSATLNLTQVEQNSLQANMSRTKTERDALMARVTGDRERLQQVGAEGVGALAKMVEEINKERAMLETKLQKAQNELQNLKWEQLQFQQTTNSPLTESSSVDVGTLRAMSQEVLAPLSAVSHYTEMLLSESVGTLSALQEQFVTRIKANLERLNRLMGDLVQATSLLQGGIAALEPVSFNLVDAIDDALTDSRHKFSEKGIVLDLDIRGDELRVEADPKAILQVLHHLIDNAYLVSPSDGTVRVAAYYEQNGNLVPQGVLVAISDQGGGIAPTMYDTVFNRIHRTDHPIVQGLGHGGMELSLVKGLIEAHQGKIWLETQENVGTTFKFTLPIALSASS